MLLRIIDKDNKEYTFDEFGSNNFTFALTKKDSVVRDYELVFTSKHELPINIKASIFNVFEQQLKNIAVKQIMILIPSEETQMDTNDEDFLTLFDSTIYNLTFETVNYYTEYRIPGNLDNVTKPFEQIALSFVFTAS